MENNAIDSILKAKQYVKIIYDEFIEKITKIGEYRELTTRCNRLDADMKGYHGREIFELLQNADDAYQKSINDGNKPDEDLKVNISYKNDILTISNTGTVFNKEGILSIVQGNDSTKHGGYIGNKGTGFRSILNWADKIEILSGYFNVEFSKKIANDVFDEIKDKEQIAKQLADNPNLHIPMLNVPKYIENEEKEHSDTTIIIYIDREKNNDNSSVSNQLKDINMRILLFLPNIKEIAIQTEENSIIYRKTSILCNENIDLSTLYEQVELEKIDNESIIKESFYVFHKKYENFNIHQKHMGHNLYMSIAVPTEYETFKEDHLYTYFPLLETYSPFKCLLHATYELGDQRNNLIYISEINDKIIEEQLRFIVDIANYFIKNGNYDTGYSLLNPSNISDYSWNFKKPFDKDSYKELFFKLLYENELFISVNGDILSLKNGAKAIKGDFPVFFKGNDFVNLIVNNKYSDKLLNLLEKYSEYKDIFYSSEELCNIINTIKDDLTLKEKVEVFLWWNKQNYEDNLPKLLKLNNGQWLECNQKCFLLEGRLTTDYMPKWVEIVALDDEYQKELIENVYSNDINLSNRIREICQNKKFPIVNFKYIDKSTIIDIVNSSVKENYNSSVLFVNWLWENYGKKEDMNWMPPDKIDYNFPTENNKVKKGELIFFGSNYGFSIADKLFSEQYSMFPQISNFDIEEHEKDNFIEFISKFSVQKYPVIRTEKIDATSDKIYYSNCEKILREHGYLGDSDLKTIKVHFKTIYNLKNIIEEQLEMYEILLWINNDIQLNNYLNNEIDEYILEYIVGKQQYYRSIKCHLKNYILYLFNKSKWIEINGKKYSPQEVVYNSERDKKNNVFESLIPTINDKLLNKLEEKSHISIQGIKNILNKFKFCKNITELNSNDFYGLLLKLPEISKEYSIDVYKSLYGIIESGEIKKIEDSDNKRKFFDEGKILVKINGVYELHSAKESFLPSPKIINSKGLPIVAKQLRTNNEIFKNIFNCQVYNRDYTLEDSSIIEHKKNSEFQNYFNDFRKYLKPFGLYNKRIDEIYKKIEIKLVECLYIIDKNSNEKEKVQNEYAFFKNDKKSHIWYITLFNEEYDVTNISFCIGDIFNNIANSGNFPYERIVNLFMLNNTQRNRYIEEYFGSLDVLENDIYCETLKENFISTFKKICPKYNVENIDLDFDNFDCDENMAKIIDIFQELNIDIDYFIEQGFSYGIDLRGYYKNQLENFIMENFTEYRNFLYTKAIENIDIQNCYAQTIYEFYNFKYDKFKNSVYEDYRKIVYDRFGDWNGSCNGDFIDAEIEYDKNYDRFQVFEIMEQKIQTDFNLQNLIYFGRIEEFNKIQTDNVSIKNKDNTQNTSKDMHIVPTEVEVVYTSYDPTQKYCSITSTYYSSLPLTSDGYQELHKQQKDIGNKGELYMYNLLCEKYGKENVKFCSESSIDFKHSKPGHIYSSAYDMRYKDNGVWYYVEVKTSKNNYFYMSYNELEFAQTHADKYKLFIVFDIDSEPKCFALPDRFWEKQEFRQKIEKIKFEFNIKYKI